MSKICQVTGKKPHFGKQLSHSHRRTSRRWDPNVQTKRYYLPSEKRWIKLNLSTKGIKTIDKRGIERVVADMRAAGLGWFHTGAGMMQTQCFNQTFRYAPFRRDCLQEQSLWKLHEPTPIPKIR